MRARYEAAAETPVAQGVNGVIALTGLYLAASPWIVGFSGLTNLAINDLITGSRSPCWPSASPPPMAARDDVGGPGHRDLDDHRTLGGGR